MSVAIAMMPFVLLVSACEPPPGQRQMVPTADPDNGRRVIQRRSTSGSGSPSTALIVSSFTAEGMVGLVPALAIMLGANVGTAVTAEAAIPILRDRGLIAGRLPNNPETLARFVRDAPSLVPGTPMPAMPMSEQEARDVAAYLYGPAK